MLMEIQNKFPIIDSVAMRIWWGSCVTSRNWQCRILEYCIFYAKYSQTMKYSTVKHIAHVVFKFWEGTVFKNWTAMYKIHLYASQNTVPRSLCCFLYRLTKACSFTPSSYESLHGTMLQLMGLTTLVPSGHKTNIMSKSHIWIIT